jgi:hypothetical protein
MSFNFQQPSNLDFFWGFSQKIFPVKIVRHLKIYQHKRFHGPTMTGASIESTSEV